MSRWDLRSISDDLPNKNRCFRQSLKVCCLASSWTHSPTARLANVEETKAVASDTYVFCTRIGAHLLAPCRWFISDPWAKGQRGSRKNQIITVIITIVPPIRSCVLADFQMPDQTKPRFSPFVNVLHPGTVHTRTSDRRADSKMAHMWTREGALRMFLLTYCEMHHTTHVMALQWERQKSRAAVIVSLPQLMPLGSLQNPGTSGNPGKNDWHFVFFVLGSVKQTKLW